MLDAPASEPRPVARAEFDAGELVANCPPRFRIESKKRLFEAITTPIQGRLGVSRWRGRLPDYVDAPQSPALEIHEGAFNYPPEEPATVTWHMNFADSELFGFYAGPLLAQDEHQVLEHPVLGALREALLHSRHDNSELVPLTVADGPTPVLVRGAQRCLLFDTVAGPYGQAFARTPYEEILRYTTFLTPPGVSNILAAAAPDGGHGPYSEHDIRAILETAFIAFRACKLESGSRRAVLHTGYWGAGAFGGHPTLMALLQLCAARMAGLDKVVFHIFSSSQIQSYQQAVDLLALMTGPRIVVADLVQAVRGRGFEWGRSDGN